MVLRPQLRPRGPAATAIGAVLAAALLITAAQAENPLEPCADAGLFQRAVQRLNELRLLSQSPCADHNANPQTLVWDARLAGSAQEQATDLALRDGLSHLDARQRSLAMRLRDAGYAAAAAGENLAAGQSDFDDALQAWLVSPVHCANLMQPGFRDVGLACVQRHGSRHERFWVAHLGAPVAGERTVSAARRDADLVASR